MAKFELYLVDIFNSQKVLINKSSILEGNEVNCIEIVFYDMATEITHSLYLDKSTAIKFAKTLRTEINKITESEVNNG